MRSEKEITFKTRGEKEKHLVGKELCGGSGMKLTKLEDQRDE